MEPQVANKLFAIEPITFDKRLKFLFVLLNKGYDAFAKVFWNILGLIARFVHYLFFCALLLKRGA